MREIKCRGWDKQYKNMIGPFSIDFIAHCEWDYKEGEIEWLEYTGLKDKNGVDIYESDVIRVCKNDKGYFEVVFKNAYVGGWLLKHSAEHDFLSLGARGQSDIEVIGNIHENPELLEEV